MQLYVILILSFSFTVVKAQDVGDLDRFKLDTLKLKGIASKKVVVYKYHSVSYILDLNEVRNEISLIKSLINQNKGHALLMGKIKKSISRQLKTSDTAYIDQKTFDSMNWIPFDDFLGNQIRLGKCLIRDANGKVSNTVISVSGIKLCGLMCCWEGTRYYLPGREMCFLEITVAVC